MKTILTLCAMGVLLSSCNSTSFTINGEIEKLETGKVVLLTSSEEKIDTLATANVVNGKFKLNGAVEEATSATLMVEGTRIMAQLILENEKFDIELSNKNPQDRKIIGGGVEQGILNEFAELYEDIMIEQNSMGVAYQEAMQNNDEAKANEISEQYTALNQAFSTSCDSLISANSNTLAAAQLAQSMTQGAELEEIEKTYNLLGEKAKATSAGKSIEKTITDLKTVAVGKVAPDFTLNTPDGKPLSLHSIKAKIKIVDFWASWCGPCRGENPNTVAIYKKYKSKGLEILGVSLDQDGEAWKKAIKEDKLTWLHVSDLKGWQSIVTPLYKINGIPHIIILDENNVIVAKNLRGAELEAKIGELLK